MLRCGWEEIIETGLIEKRVWGFVLDSNEYGWTKCGLQ
jgi:hypothetical protein